MRTAHPSKYGIIPKIRTVEQTTAKGAMAKPTKKMAVSESKLVETLSKSVQHAVGVAKKRIDSKREIALKRYNRDPLPGDEELVGRSKYQTPDIMERVDWLTAQSVKLLDHSRQVVSFQPNGPEDAPKADQMSETCNFVLRNKNSHVAVLTPTFRNAFLTGTGIIMAEFRQCKEESKSQLIKGITFEQYMEYDAQEEAGEIIVEEVGKPYKAKAPAPQPGIDPNAAAIADLVQPEVFDIKVRYIKKYPQLNLKNLPPEDFIVSEDADFDQQTGGINASLQGHRTFVTRKALAKNFKDAKDKIAKIPKASDKDDGLARERSRDTDYQQGITEPNDKVAVYEIFTFIEIESDTPRHYRITLAGDLENAPVLLGYEEVTKFYPYAAFVPFPISNTLFGQSIVDRIGDEQKLRSQMTRAVHDGLNKSVHPIPVINMDAITNPDDVLNLHHGKPIRTNGNPDAGISFVNQPFNGMNAMPVIESLSQTMDFTTGVGGGLATVDPSTVQNKTATEASQQASQQQVFIEHICRWFADTGYRYVVKVIIDLLVENPELAQPYIARLTNNAAEWKVDQWDPDMDVTANVAFGVTDKLGNQANLQMIYGLQQQLQGLGIANAQTLYLTATKIAENAGFKLPFFVDPSTLPPAPPQEPPPDPNAGLIEVEKVKAQLKSQSDAENRQFEMWKARLDDDRERDRDRAQEMLAARELELKYAAQVDIARIQMEQARQRNDADFAIEAQKAQVQATQVQAQQAQAQQQAVEAEQQQAAQAQQPQQPMPPQGV